MQRLCAFRLRCDVQDSYYNCLPCKWSPQIVYVAIVVVAVSTAIAAALKSPIIQPVKNVLIKVIQQRFHHYTTVTDWPVCRSCGYCCFRLNIITSITQYYCCWHFSIYSLLCTQLFPSFCIFSIKGMRVFSFFYVSLVI